MKKVVLVLATIVPMLAIGVWVNPISVSVPEEESPCSFYPTACFQEMDGEEEKYAYLFCRIENQIKDQIKPNIVHVDSIKHVFSADEIYEAVFAEVTLEVNCYEICFWTVDERGCDICEKPLIRDFCCVAAEEEPEQDEVTLDIKPLPSSVSVYYGLNPGQTGFLHLYDCTGNVVDKLQISNRGSSNLGEELTPGVYFVRLEAGRTRIVQKVALTH
ncbi:T9SS type A sorting domain-containing protein [candidate division WOR-3 bacterium]|nr:T9SS type A sorting domain-containing protein [candidate division WOR-3 bacterium]